MSFRQMLADCRQTARLGLLLSLAAALHIVEAQLPALPLPGAKLGFANLVTVLVLYTWGWREGLLVAVLRQILGGLFTGALLGPPFWFGATGAVLSTLIMGGLVTLSRRRLSPVVVSMLGAVAHNMGQLAVAYALVRQAAVMAYLPYLLLLALPAGAVVGYLARLLLPVLQEELLPADDVQPMLYERRASFAVAGVIGVVLVAVALLYQAAGHDVAASALHANITVDGQCVAQLPLHVDAVYDVPLLSGHLRVDISEGGVAVLESDCPDQVCVHTGRIRRPGQAVICVPHKVMVSVAQEIPVTGESEIDAVSG